MTPSQEKPRRRRARKIVHLADRRLDPVPLVVEYLEDLLAQAKRGEIRGFVFAAVGTAGNIITSKEYREGGGAALFMAMERLKFRILADLGAE